MRAAIRVRDVGKTFALAENGGGAVSLLHALRAGKRNVGSRLVHALEGINFEIGESERVGIIGRNGAGKTTLLSIMAGLTEPTSGRVEVDGDVHAMLTIGAVLRDDMSGRDNIYLDAAVHGRSRDETEAIAGCIVEFAELGEFIDRPVRTYSSGMKARLAFAMGAFIKPDILIIDETLSVGDAFFAAKAARRMQEIAANGRIVIVVSHGLRSIVDMCTRCIWLDSGRLMMDGPPEAVTQAFEAAVREADEAELMRKFGGGGVRPDGEVWLESVVINQDGQQRSATAIAMVAVTIEVRGRLPPDETAGDLIVNLLRVDGRLVWRQSLSQTGGRLPADRPFTVTLHIDPFILGADLYRLDVALTGPTGDRDRISRVLEVVDVEGQFGGKPLIFYPPCITARRLGDIPG